jgi:hypothetical protein
MRILKTSDRLHSTYSEYYTVRKAQDLQLLFIGDLENCIKFIKGLDNAIAPEYLDVRLLDQDGTEVKWHD